MYWRAHAREHGPHTTVRLFVAEAEERTFVGVGQLTMRRPEWEDLQKRLDLGAMAYGRSVSKHCTGEKV